MELPPDVPQPVDQGPLDVHVHVFELDAELEAALLNFLANLFQGLHNFPALVVRDQPHFGQHANVHHRAPNVMGVQPPSNVTLWVKRSTRSSVAAAKTPPHGLCATVPNALDSGTITGRNAPKL